MVLSKSFENYVQLLLSVTVSPSEVCVWHEGLCMTSRFPSFHFFSLHMKSEPLRNPTLEIAEYVKEVEPFKLSN